MTSHPGAALKPKTRVSWTIGVKTPVSQSLGNTGPVSNSDLGPSVQKTQIKVMVVVTEQI